LNDRKVVVTGIGVVSPIGNGLESFRENLFSGKSGIGYISNFDTSDFQVKIAGEVKDFDPSQVLSKKEIGRLDEYIIFAVAASDEAVKDAQLENGIDDMDRVGVIVGSGVGGLKTIEAQHERLLNRGPHGVSPFFIPMHISDMAAGKISMLWGFKGPNYCVVSACSTAAHAIGDAMRLIQYGDADIIISGGAEASIRPLSVAGFSRMKALSTRNEEPEKASRPFDKERDGFVLGEGAAILVLEEAKHAQKRGVKIYCEIAGYGATADAYHLTAPSPGGEGAIRAMNRAINDADLKPIDIDYLNAHGTSTLFNDKTETQAIKGVFGDYAYDLHISSTKSMMGHLLGASGGVEAIASIIAINNNQIPPTINYETPDPECDLNYTPNKAVSTEVNVAISNSFGFGGHNAVILMKQWEN